MGSWHSGQGGNNGKDRSGEHGHCRGIGMQQQDKGQGGPTFLAAACQSISLKLTILVKISFLVNNQVLLVKPRSQLFLIIILVDKFS